MLAAGLGTWIADGFPSAPVLLDQQALHALTAHGLDALVAAALESTRSHAQISIEPGVADQLRRQRAALIAAELTRRPAVDRALAALRDGGICALLIKGEALARTHYPLAGTRVRTDADVWVREAEFEPACVILRRLNWSRIAAADGIWQQPERAFRAADGSSVIDLHRRLLSQPLLARAIPFDSAVSAAVSIDQVAMPGPAHALLLAALHLYGHHADTLRAIWLFDIDRLVRAGALEHSARLACDAGVASVLHCALVAARHNFGTPLQQAIIERLETVGSADRASVLLQPMSRARRMWVDLRTLPDWRARGTWIHELLLPDPAWMRARHGPGPLPWLYLKRWLRSLRSLRR